MEKLSFNEQIEQSIKDNWDLDALSDYKGETFQYKDIARIIEKLHIIFEYSNVKPGDKIALCEMCIRDSFNIYSSSASGV